MRICVFPFLILLPALLSAAEPDRSCEASASVRQELKRLQLPNLEGRAREKARKDIVEQLLRAHPDDLFVHLRYQGIFGRRTEAERQALIDRYRKLAESHPGDNQYQFLYAEALLDKDTPQSAALAQKLTAASAAFPRAHLLLANIYSYGKFADRAKARQELDSFFTACPATLDNTALGLAQRYGGQELAARLVPELRDRLSKETDPYLLQQWGTVWNLEFKSQPPAEHDQVRQQIAADLAKLRTANAKPDASWLQLLGTGYRFAGDEAAASEQESKLLVEFPSSPEARQIDDERWYKAHPWPGSDKAKQTEYWRATLARADAGLKTQPRNERYLIGRFNALSNLNDVPPDQLTSAANTLLAVTQENRDFFSNPPFELQVAQSYVKRKIHVEEVPRLVSEAWSSRSYAYGVSSDRSPLDIRASSDAFIAREAALVLLDAAEQLHKPEIAKEAVEKTAALKSEKPFEQSMQYKVPAKWAELQGRKLDALLLYRAALDARPANPAPPADDEVSKNFDRLAKELGGTDIARELLVNRPKPAAATAEGQWERPDKEMKAWQLSDLNGKTWKLASLEGKTVLINVWATWCGPCKAEHPHLQKLYDRIKNDPAVQIITFNVDDEMGNVAPYLKENNYTFPVLFAKEYTDDLSVDSIPRNWIVDAKGKWEWQQIGFGSGDKWEDEMLAKLKEAK